MGLGGFKSAWQRQTLHFGHERRDQYSVMLIDNRGMGDSDTPLMRYSTSEMALDIAEVLADPSVGWLPSFPLPSSPPPTRTLHVVGISLGGMIAQELAVILPTSLASLSLICTAAAIENTTTFAENMAQRASLLLPKSLDRSVADAARQIFAHDWLVQPDDAHLPKPGITPNCHPPPPPTPPSPPPTTTDTAPTTEYLHFPTNAHRFVAQEVHKRLDARGRFKLAGFVLQLIAAGWHHKSGAQLGAMADAVGRARILVVHGTADGMISVPHGRKLIDFVKPGKGLVVEGMGHAPLVERCVWFNGLVEEQCRVGAELSGRE